MKEFSHCPAKLSSFARPLQFRSAQASRWRLSPHGLNSVSRRDCLTLIALVISNPNVAYCVVFKKEKSACELRLWDWESWATRWPRIW